MKTTASASPKQKAHALIAEVPHTASWDDGVYRLTVRRSIERGLADIEAGRLTDLEELRWEFGLPE